MALLSPGLSITKIKEEITLDGLRAALILIITDWLLAFNVVNTMKGSQIGECVDLLILEFPNYKLEDFKVCLMYSKTSRYGKVYNRIDTPVVFDMFREYDKERKDILANAQIKQSGDIKMLDAGTPRVGWTPERLKGIKDLANEIIGIENAKKVIKITAPNEAYQRDNKWLRQFDMLWNKNPVKEYKGEKVHGKFIKRSGKIMAPTEFLKYKLNQLQIITEYLTKKQKA